MLPGERVPSKSYMRATIGRLFLFIFILFHSDFKITKKNRIIAYITKNRVL